MNCMSIPGLSPGLKSSPRIARKLLGAFGVLPHQQVMPWLLPPVLTTGRRPLAAWPYLASLSGSAGS